MRFIQRSNDYATKDKTVPAPYFRKSFCVKKEIQQAKLRITGLGFYIAYVNGEDITKGFLAPYRSNLNDYVYYAEYEVTTRLQKGQNVLACVLGNGWQNAIGGYIWSFDKATWRGSCKLAFELTITYEDASVEIIESDEAVRTNDSPIVFNDLHYGEYYDARLE